MAAHEKSHVNRPQSSKIVLSLIKLNMSALRGSRVSIVKFWCDSKETQGSFHLPRQAEFLAHCLHLH